MPPAKKSEPANAAAYIASQPQPMRRLLATVRATIRKAVPGAKEDIAYGFVRYKLDGTMLLYFAGWKHHYSLYPAYPSITSALKKELAPHTVDKGTIRFSSTEAVPTGLVAKIARLRAAEVRAAAKPTKRTKRSNT